MARADDFREHPDIPGRLRVRLQLRRQLLGDVRAARRRRRRRPEPGPRRPWLPAAGVPGRVGDRRPLATAGVDVRTDPDQRRPDPRPDRAGRPRPSARSSSRSSRTARPSRRRSTRCSGVLLVGGAVVVLVAIGFGAVYARRALVPIRDSLAAQRLALRRQREFAADASHELRTPLTVVRSSVEFLRRHPDEPVSDDRRGARRRRRRGRPDDVARRRPAAARPLRFRRGRPRPARRSTWATSPRPPRRRWRCPPGRRTSGSSSTRSRRWSRATRSGSGSS